MVQTNPRWQQLLTAFSTEIEERVPALNQLLLRLERNGEGEAPRAETLDALFREAHSLKGAARAVRLGPVEQVAHALESALDRLRRSDAAPAPAWLEAAFRAVDALGPLYQLALDGQEPPPAFPDLLAGLDPDRPAPAKPAAPAKAAPPAEPPPEAPPRPAAVERERLDLATAAPATAGARRGAGRP